MRIVISLLILIHGVIHLLGFLKAFSIYDFKTLTLPISKTFGVLWFIGAALIIFASITYYFKVNYWWLIGFIALIISQFVIIYFWKDAKYGTIMNVVLLVICFVGYGMWSLQNDFRNDIQTSFEKTTINDNELITAQDLEHLPNPVQNYLRYVGVIGHPKVKSFRAVYKVKMRSKDQDWFTFTSEQYSFTEDPTRLYFLEARFKGLPTVGYHKYMDEQASMKIKLLGWIPVADEKGEALFKAETVTYFNDLCVMAPGALIDPKIFWKTINDSVVEATFTNKGVTIKAQLFFNEKGQLVNFISNDRLDINENKNYPFSTPLGDYKKIGAFMLPHHGEAVWEYDDGLFTYGKFELKSIEYNVSE